MCCQWDNAVDVVILPPYVPSEEEKASPALYARNVQKLYAETLYLPIVNQVIHVFPVGLKFNWGILLTSHDRPAEFRCSTYAPAFSSSRKSYEPHDCP